MNDLARLGVLAGIMTCGVLGAMAAGEAGLVVGSLSGLMALVIRWRRLRLWEWAALCLRRHQRIDLAEPVTVANDRSGGGVRYQDDVAVVAVQILGRRYQPTVFTGSSVAETTNTIDVAELLPLLNQSLGLTIESLSVVSGGARRRAAGDYPRVYDTLIGTPPYAGQRETWLVVRIRGRDNADALCSRATLGTATVAAAQRIAMTLRCSGIRARVATVTDILELERRLCSGALEVHNRRWNSVRDGSGWLTTYAYRPSDVTTEGLAEAWSMRVDGIIQNITVYPDGTATAIVTVRTPKPLAAAPSVRWQSLPGEQAQAIAASLCCPRPALRGVARHTLPASVVVGIGPSGVLLGKTASGDRLLMPLGDGGEPSRVRICADDAIAKRIVIRAAAAGERITVHTTDLVRWESVRMPNIAVVEHPRPAPGTTLSVVDGSVPPSPRPNTVVSVAASGEPVTNQSDVDITQVGSATVMVSAVGITLPVDVEFFRAENRYIGHRAISEYADLKAVP